MININNMGKHCCENTKILYGSSQELKLVTFPDNARNSSQFLTENCFLISEQTTECFLFMSMLQIILKYTQFPYVNNTRNQECNDDKKLSFR